MSARGPAGDALEEAPSSTPSTSNTAPQPPIHLILSNLCSATVRAEEHLYTPLPLPALDQKHICIIFNNTNGIKTEKEEDLAATCRSYLQHQPTIISIIETQRNWMNYDQTPTRHDQLTPQCKINMHDDISLQGGAHQSGHIQAQGSHTDYITTLDNQNQHCWIR